MPHFVATYRYAPGSEERRDALRARHREHLAGLDALVLSGPTQRPGGGGQGAVLVFEAPSAADVEGWLDEDPFTTAGDVVEERTVVEWTVVMGRAKDRV